MMRSTLLVIVFLLGAGSAVGQALPAGSAPDSLAAAPPVHSSGDTLRALHRLFAGRRQRRDYLLVGTMLTTAAGVGIAGSAPGPAPSQAGSGFTVGPFDGDIIDERKLSMVVIGLFGTAVVASEVLFFHQYSQKREQRAVAAFQAHRLPESLRRKLKPRYFR